MDTPLHGHDSVLFENVGKRPWAEETGLTPVQRFFLMRLERLCRLSQELRQNAASGFAGGNSAEEKWRRNLLDRAMYSTFRDCVNLGLIDQARLILASAKEKKDQITSQ